MISVGECVAVHVGVVVRMGFARHVGVAEEEERWECLNGVGCETDGEQAASGGGGGKRRMS